MALRTVLLPLVVACLTSSALAAPPPPAGPDVTREALFDDGWRFHRGDATGAERVAVSTTRPGAPSYLPHDWSIEDLPSPDGVEALGAVRPGALGGEGRDRLGGGRHGLVPKALPASAPRRPARRVRFDGVYMDADVWLNGRHLGHRPYGYSSFALDLTKHASVGENVLAVRVRNDGQNSRWYSGSGIYRHVWLTTTGPLHVPLWGVTVTTPEVTAASATVIVVVNLANDGAAAPDARVRVGLVGPDGESVGRGEALLAVSARGTASTSVKVTVSQPRLWSPATPSLHRAVVEVVAGRQGRRPRRRRRSASGRSRSTRRRASG